MLAFYECQVLNYFIQNQRLLKMKCFALSNTIKINKEMRKKSIIILAVTALLFAGCRNTKEEGHDHDSDGNHTNTESVHEHDDGSVHEDHKDAEHSQEEFKVESDSTSNNVEEHGHSHEDGSNKH